MDEDYQTYNNSGIDMHFELRGMFDIKNGDKDIIMNCIKLYSYIFNRIIFDAYTLYSKKGGLDSVEDIDFKMYPSLTKTLH